MNVRYLDSTAPSWAAQIENVRAHLGAPENPLLLPEHFLKVVLPKLGGQVVEVQHEGHLSGYGLLFPRRYENSRREYTLRYYALSGGVTVEPEILAHHLGHDLQARIYFYDPSSPKTYAASHYQVGTLDVGCPGPEEAPVIRSLQQQVWGNPPDLLYPTDIHSVEFRLATSLLARAEDMPVGFLFGFYKMGGSTLPLVWQNQLNQDWRIESQTMGVLPTQRGRSIGFMLKMRQAAKARSEGIDIINWTADPLLFANATLNFSKLQAVAFEFHPALYDLHNDLNQVAASRFSLTWLVRSGRVRSLLTEPAPGPVNLTNRNQIVRVNQAYHSADFGVDAPLVAFEIPGDWYTLQRTNLEIAQHWRELTDRLFSHYLGSAVGKYMITAAGVDEERRYLIGERIDDYLLERLVQ